MWSIRRAFNPLKKQGSWVVTARFFYAESELAWCLENSNTGFTGHHRLQSDISLSSTRFFNSSCVSPNLVLGMHTFSSQAGTKSSGEEDDDLEDGFSELETSSASDITQESTAADGNEDELTSELEILEEDDDDSGVEGPRDELNVSDIETEVEKKPLKKSAVSDLFKAVLAAPGLSVGKVLDKWVEEGNKVTRSEISVTMVNLRKRSMYGRALQLSEWLELHNHEFLERDYASRVDLIAKMRGLQKAESYIETIPQSFRGEVVYRTLLANCVFVGNVKKSEEVFNKMKDLEFPITTFAYNQLLLLYKRCDKKKIADVLLLMEKEDVKPSPFTYRILIDVKGQSNDMTGMDKIVETMKADGIEPDFATQAILVKHYASGGLKEKAEAVLKEVEGANIKENRWAFPFILPLYATLGKADDVERIWQVCESNPRLMECVAAIDAWGTLKKVEEAEAVFDTMCKKFNKLSSKYYAGLLKIYTDHKLLAKGKELVKRMADSGCNIGPQTWDALVKLYIEAGEVEKADSILHKAVERSRQKPLICSYLAIMDQYAKRGDIHNTEKMFLRMRQAGYVARVRPFQSLIQAYINAKAPAYGIAERMKADNVYPNKSLAAQLAQVDAFKKTPVSDLLD